MTREIETASRIFRRGYKTFAPPPKLTISEWADKHRVLTSDSSAEPGRWQTDRAPFQREPMDAILEDSIHTVVLQWCAQMGKSEILFNTIGYFATQDPCPLMMLQPTISMAQAVSVDRIAPMVSASPLLQETFADPKSRDSSATQLHKTFPGGQLDLTGGNSAASLASRPKRGILGDEIDRLPDSAGTEGDPWKLAWARTKNFHNRFAIMVSTPTVKGESRIEFAYEQSDQRRFFLACPHCDHRQHLQWGNVQWAKDKKGKWDNSPPWYCCEHCGSKIEESQKWKMLQGGEWQPTAVPDDPGVRGYHINELYSPWRSWALIVAEFYEAKGDRELVKVWTNTCLGETFEDDAEELAPDSLQKRAEQYKADIPAGGVVLTAGVDTQDDRFEVQVDAWGRREECFRVDYHIIHGDPANPDVRQALDDFLGSKKYKHESGAIMGISAAAIDSGGHKTQQVYDFCRGKLGRRIFCIKGGSEGFGVPMVSAPSRRKSGRNRRKVDLWTLGVDDIKLSIHSRLSLEEPGPGYIHFPISDAFDEEYFKQLAGEKLVTKLHKGKPKRFWKPTRPRNEALDCSVYSYAALLLLNANLDAIAERMEKTMESGDKTPEAEEATLQRRRASRGKRRGGFVNNWK